MDNTTKQHILNDCNNHRFTIDVLDDFVAKGFITLDEFKQHNLEISKVKELEKRQNFRDGIIEKEPEIIKEEPITVVKDVKPFSSKKTIELKKIIEKKVSAKDIIDNIVDKVYTWEDLKQVEIAERTFLALKYFSQPRNQKFYKISDLPKMENGRTDVYFVGLPATGKSTILSGLLRYATKEGIIIPDSYNKDGNVYQSNLINDLDKGVLPKATAKGSYNYIATSLKDTSGKSHPLNIVEVPGENYTKIHENGFKSDEVLEFVNYIKNPNKKILIFIIDALAFEDRFSEKRFNELDQNSVYLNILTMLKDNKVLHQTEAIYFIVNKFDILKNGRFSERTEKDSALAKEFLDEDFKAIINFCLDARNNSRNKFQIKIFPFSIGELSYEVILEKFNSYYPKVIVDNVLQDSFVVKGGGGFFTKMFK